MNDVLPNLLVLIGLRLRLVVYEAPPAVDHMPALDGGLEAFRTRSVLLISDRIGYFRLTR